MRKTKLLLIKYSETMLLLFFGVVVQLWQKIHIIYYLFIYINSKLR